LKTFFTFPTYYGSFKKTEIHFGRNFFKMDHVPPKIYKVSVKYKMPRNTQGGSGHKSQKNSEGNKARNNRLKGDALIEDLMDEVSTEGIVVGKVTRRLGCGRMEVAYFSDKGEAFLLQAPLRGGMRGKGKKSVWVDIGSLVMVADTELSGKTHEIIAVMSQEQVVRYRKAKPDADARLFIKDANVEEDKKDEVIFEDDEVNIDSI
jgi:hypothetical protein